MPGGDMADPAVFDRIDRNARPAVVFIDEIVAVFLTLIIAGIQAQLLDAALFDAGPAALAQVSFPKALVPADRHDDGVVKPNLISFDLHDLPFPCHAVFRDGPVAAARIQGGQLPHVQRIQPGLCRGTVDPDPLPDGEHIRIPDGNPHLPDGNILCDDLARAARRQLIRGPHLDEGRLLGGGGAVEDGLIFPFATEHDTAALDLKDIGDRVRSGLE